ncbi:MAG: ArnT family glycosyltransferase [Aggregatilineales bacterium]
MTDWNLKARHFRGLLLAIVIFSFATRLLLVDYNLPPHIVEDEGSDLSTAAQLLTGELPQRHVRYQRGLIASNNLIPIAGVFAINFVTGQINSVDAFQDLYFTDRAQFTLATRIWMSLLTSTAIGLIGLATGYYRREAGILAALILTINGFVLHTTLFAMPDALVFFAAGFSLFMIMRLWHYRRSRDYVFAALSLALVMLAKLQAAPMGLAFLLVHGMIVYDSGNKRPLLFLFAYFRDKNLWIAALAGISGNVLFNPLAFIHPDDFLYEASRFSPLLETTLFETGVSSQQRLITEFEKLVVIAWRWAFVLTMTGLFFSWRLRRNQAYWIFLAASVPVFIITIRSQIFPITHFYYWTPFIALMAPVAAIGLWEVVLWLAERQKPLVRVALLPVVVFVVLEGSFFLHIFNIMQQPLTLEQALDYVEENIPPDSTVMIGDTLIYSVALQRTETSIRRAADLSGRMLSRWQYQLDNPDAVTAPLFDIYGAEMFALFDSFDEMVQLIDDEQVQYFIVADYCDGRLIDPSASSSVVYPPVDPDMVSAWNLLAVFSPYDTDECGTYIHTRTKITFFDDIVRQQRGGPIVRIYEIPQN